MWVLITCQQEFAYSLVFIVFIVDPHEKKIYLAIFCWWLQEEVYLFILKYVCYFS
jgi:hypothetical protein